MAQSSLSNLAAFRHKPLDHDATAVAAKGGAKPTSMPVNETKDVRERSFRIQHAAILGIFLLGVLQFLEGNVDQYLNSAVISDIGDIVKESLPSSSSSSSTTGDHDRKEAPVWTQENRNDILRSFRNIESGIDICTPFLDTPFPYIWESLFPTIVNASKNGLPVEVFNNRNFTAWFQESASFFSFPTLRRSTQHAPEHMQMKAILEKIRQRQQQEKQHEKGENGNATADKGSSGKKQSAVQIQVMGTSQTSGVDCMENPIHNFKLGSEAITHCAWPARWQHALNAIFPPNTFSITNMAMSGSASDVSASIMEYNIWPKDRPHPDVIIWDHGVVELAQYDESIVHEHVRMFQEASRNVQFCRNDLPLVVYVDSTPALFEPQMSALSSQMYVTNAIHATASWHNTMAISYVDVVRPYTYSHVKETEMEKSLFGVKGYTRHLGLMFHVTTAWVVMFNWLLVLSETCLLEKVLSRQLIEGPTPATNKSQKLSNIIPNAVENNELPMKDIPAISNLTLQYWQVQDEWESRSRTRRDACGATSSAGDTTDSAAYNPMVCSYLWLVNRAASVVTKQDVAANIGLFMTHNDGWEAQGFPIRSPRPGWIATKRNATFVMEYPLHQHLKYLTMISMLSYSNEWVNSTLQITLELLSNSPSSTSTGTEDVDKKRGRMVRHNVTGYHKEISSIIIPQKLRLPEAVVEVGDVLRVEMKLVGGETFKISGMGLCPV